MGADIHMVLERRWQPPPADGKTPATGAPARWVGVNAFLSPIAGLYAHGAQLADGSSIYDLEATIRWPILDRNYALFAALAGDMADGPAPRGLPEDVSDLALMQVEEWDGDGHTHTHMLMSEAAPVFVRYALRGAQRVMHGADADALNIEALRYFDGDVDVPLSDYRLIIWFDN